MRPQNLAELSNAADSSSLRGRCIALRIDPSRMRRVHQDIVARLAAEGARVSVEFAEPTDRLPAAVDLLFDLERIIYRLRGLRPSDRCAWAGKTSPNAAPDVLPDLIFDLSGGERTSDGRRVIRPLYDGVPGEAALIGALTAGRMPIIDMEDTQAGVLLARGAPCADDAPTMLEAYECALARLATLVIAMARGASPFTPVTQFTARPLRLRDMAVFEGKSLVRSLVRRLYYLCCYAPHWRTCWRTVEGPDLLDTRTLKGTAWNVIPDPGFGFYADPFPIAHNGGLYLFVEDFDHKRNKAVISVIPFDAGGPVGPAQPVLEEPWHLSYPFVMPHEGQIWMIPESSAARRVNLYRADPFPHRWVREATLVENVEASDATIVHHGDRFWMFAATRDGTGSWSDTLSLFSASKLQGPWLPHPANPILIDKASARPAGAVVVRDGKMWRPVQDCSRGYGTGIGIVEVTRLDEGEYSQHMHCIMHSDPNWPGQRFHTLNRAGLFEFIDGSAYSPRSRHAARLMENWSGRRETPQQWQHSSTIAARVGVAR